MSVSIAFIPLMPKARLSAAAIRDTFSRDWPKLPPLVSEKGEKDQLCFQMDDQHVIIAVMRAPLPPGSDMDEMLQSSLMWPKAADELRGHTGHLVVTLLSKAPAMKQAMLLTFVCKSILASCDEAPGIVWYNARMLVKSQVFQEFAATMLTSGPPLHVWLNLRAGKGPNGKTNGFTRGMTALGFMEFETETASEPPGELRERFLALANYLLQNGPVIKDGNTIGEDANERIKVVYASSKFGNEGKVMRLEYSPAKKGWFK